jgi:hypothetical protein
MYNLLNNYNSTNYYAQYMVHVFFAANAQLSGQIERSEICSDAVAC